MVQILRLDEGVPDSEESFAEFGVTDTARQIIQTYGEIGVLHLPGHCIFDASVESERSIDVDFSAWKEHGSEKRETLDVIPVRMADQDVDLRERCRRVQKRGSQCADAGTAVEDDQIAVFGLNLDAGCVSTVAESPRPWAGYGTSGPPKAN